MGFCFSDSYGQAFFFSFTINMDDSHSCGIRQIQFYWPVSKKLYSLKGQQREPEGKKTCISSQKLWWLLGNVKCVNVSIWSSFSSFSLFQEIQSRRSNLFLVLQNHRIFPVTKIFKKYSKYKCPPVPRGEKKLTKKHLDRKAGKRKAILLRFVIPDMSVEKESVSNA